VLPERKVFWYVDHRKDGVEEVIIGMAHRGRLNVLVNILGKK